MNLRCEGSPADPRSFYKTEFCERHDKAAKELGLEANPEAYAMVSSWHPHTLTPCYPSVNHNKACAGLHGCTEQRDVA